MVLGKSSPAERFPNDDRLYLDNLAQPATDFLILDRNLCIGASLAESSLLVCSGKCEVGVISCGQAQSNVVYVLL